LVRGGAQAGGGEKETPPILGKGKPTGRSALKNGKKNFDADQHNFIHQKKAKPKKHSAHIERMAPWSQKTFSGGEPEKKKESCV